VVVDEAQGKTSYRCSVNFDSSFSPKSAMRTSGAATESRMTLAMAIIALGVVMVLAGGPKDLMLACERGLQAAAESIYQAWLSVTR
jgi:hypothetical protein